MIWRDCCQTADTTRKTRGICGRSRRWAVIGLRARLRFCVDLEDEKKSKAQSESCNMLTLKLKAAPEGAALIEEVLRRSLLRGPAPTAHHAETKEPNPQQSQSSRLRNGGGCRRKAKYKLVRIGRLRAELPNTRGGVKPG
jgi:hypothetical protein